MKITRNFEFKKLLKETIFQFKIKLDILFVTYVTTSQTKKFLNSNAICIIASEFNALTENNW